MNGFKLFRNDRCWLRGGGVCLYIDCRFKVKVICDYFEEGIVESLFVEISMLDEKVLIGVVYLPHGDFNKCENMIMDVSGSYNNCIIMGDFNTDMFTKSHVIRDFCFRSNLCVVHNSLPTHIDLVHNSSSLLDYFFVTDFNKVFCKRQYQFPALNSGHAIISISYEIKSKPAQEEIWVRNYPAINLERCFEYLCQLDSSPFFCTPSVDEQLAIFNRILFGAFNDSVPLRKVVTYDSDRWMQCNEIKNARNLRNLAWRAFCESNTAENRKIYCKYRNKLKAVIRSKRRNHSMKYFSKCSQSQFWSKLKSVGALGDDVVNDFISVDEFNRHSILPELHEPDISFYDYNNSSDLKFRNVTEHDVVVAMSTIKSNCVGPDGIPLKFLKIVFPKISRHLTYLINSIITSCVFPKNWKIGKVVPIPKIKTPRSIADYRPISILNTSKIFEILIRNQIQEFIHRNRIINPYQSGFRKGYNTTGLVMDLVENVRCNLDKSLISVLVLLDLSKAFVSISHRRLCWKLNNEFRFSRSACLLMMAFLSNRFQYVEYRGNKSAISRLYRGVPQGSILGPLLFMLYMNDLYCKIEFGLCYTYADDIQILMTDRGHGPDYLSYNINKELERVADWADDNFLNLNPGKTKAMLFSSYPKILIRGKSIEYVLYQKVLGVYIDSRLEFSYHINSVISRVSFVLLKLYNLGIFLPINVKKRIALALCLPLFLYGIEIFSGTSQQNLEKLRMCFNRVVRFVYGLHYRDHITEYIYKFIGCDIQSLIDQRIMLLFYKIIKYNRPSYLAQKFNFGNSTRSNILIYPNYTSLHMNRSFVVRVVRVWNSLLPSQLRNFGCPVHKYKSELSKCL